jgi:hypothetical protein
MKFNFSKKFQYKKHLSLFLIVLGLFVAILSTYSFFESVRYPNNPYLPTSTYISYQIKNSSKRMFLDNIDKMLGKVFLFFTPNFLIKEKLLESDVVHYEIDLPLSSKYQLNKNLPGSGQKYQPAKLTLKGEKIDAEIRYHGDNDFHWAYEKKSIRIKTKDGLDLVLINPKHSSIVSSLAGYWFADKLNLLIPKTNFAGVFINNEFKGIYLQVEKLDDDFLLNRTLEGSIFRGENVGKDNIHGLSLFTDYSTWNIAGGDNINNDITPLLTSVADDRKKLDQVMDYNYAARVLSFYSFVESTHIDRQHNWNFYLEDNKYSPIIWDPVAWVMRANDGNKIDEAHSDLTRKLRKDPIFNDLFYSELWKLINNYDQYLIQYLDEEWDKIYPILRFDFFKGGAWPVYNEGGPRKRESVKQVEKNFINLKKKIINRANFLKISLNEGKIKVLVNQNSNGFYISYEGITNVILKEIIINSRSYSPSNISIFNKGSFVLLNNPSELISGKTIDLGNFKQTYYDTCSTFYKIDLPIYINNKDTELSFKVINKITGKDISVEIVDQLPLSDCLMDLDSSEELVSTNTENKFIKDEIKSSLLMINLDISKSKIEELVHQEDDDKKIDLTIDNKKFSGKLRLTKNSQSCPGDYSFSLSLDEPYSGHKEYILENFSCNNYFDTQISQEISKQLNLLTPHSSLITLNRDGDGLGTYYLVISNEDKSFFETQSRTFDTEIYEKITSEDSLNISSWKKKSTDPRLAENSYQLLEKLISLIKDDPELGAKYFDKNNLVNYYHYLLAIGNYDPNYLLYFNNTSGRFEFIPNNFNLNLLEEDFEIKDELLKAIFNSNYFKQSLEKENRSLQSLNVNLIKDQLSNLVNDLPPVYMGNNPNLVISPANLVNQSQIVAYNLKNSNSIINKLSNEAGLVQERSLSKIKEKFLKANPIFKNSYDNQVVLSLGEYKINQTIIVPVNLKLIVEPGAKLIFAAGKSLVSHSQVFAQGTTDLPIEFISTDNDKWGVVAVLGHDADGSIFENCVFDNGFEDYIDNTYLSGMLSVYHADDVVVKNSIFKNAQADDALNFKYSNSSVYDSLFEDNSADAIDFDYVSGEIGGNTFINNGNDSIDTSGSTTLVRNNYIKDSGDKCISVGEKSYLTITNNILDGCNIGIETKDESEPVITQTVFKNNKVALNAYQKKDFFGSAYPSINTSLFINNDKNVTLENSFVGKKIDSDDSKITVTDSIFDHLSDKKLLEKNKEIKDLTDQNQYFIDKVIGLVYPEQVPQL